MTAKPVVLREAAAHDIDEALGQHATEGGEAAALRFVEELERALGHLSRHPESGSPRYGHELGVPGLRSWLLQGSRHLVFYVKGRDRVDVWRVLHERRDIPPSLREPG